MKLPKALLDLLFPPKCPFCGRVQDRPGVCGRCEEVLPWLAEGDALWLLPDGTRCAAPLRYEGLAREGLRRFKFLGVSASAEPLGELTARCAAERLSGEFDAVTWVPVSRRRLRQRGYDQAELLARAACRLWDVQPLPLLRKLRDNPAQSGLEDAGARRENVRDVYAASSGAAGRRVLLIDDICTTGSTLSACAEALRQSGAESVVCCTAARTMREKVHSSAIE